MTRSRRRTTATRTRERKTRLAPRDLLALFTAPNLDALIDTTFQVVRAAVVCDFVSAVYRNAGTGLLKERDSRGREYGPAFMRRYAELTPARPLALSSPGIKILATRTGLPGPIGTLRRSAFYREVMRPQGWRHAVSLCFWGAQPAGLPILVTPAYRREGRRDFSPRDVAALRDIHPFVDCAVNRIYEREAAATMNDGILMMSRSSALGCAILDRSLLLVQANGMARRLCAAWADDGLPAHGKDAQPWRLPAVLAAACHELHDQWHALVRADPDAAGLRRQRRVAHPRLPEFTAWVTMVCPSTPGLAEPTFVIEFDRRAKQLSHRTTNRSVPILEQLTIAERTVALVLADGYSNQDIANRLGKSVHAVKFLLHKIYDRTGVPNRAALVAALRQG